MILLSPSQKELRNALELRQDVIDETRNIFGRRVEDENGDEVYYVYTLDHKCILPLIAYWDGEDWSFPVLSLPTEKTQKTQKYVSEILRTRVLTTLRICVDCMVSMANGEPHPNEEDFENVAGSPAYKGNVIVNGDDGEDGEGYGFSWTPCEMCGSHLGGDRYQAVVFNDKI